MAGFNTIPGAAGGGGAGALTFVASVHMTTYNRSWAQAGTAGYYAIYSQNQEAGYAYFVGSGTTTGLPLNRMQSVSHAFTRIDIIAPSNDLISLYKVKVKATTEFTNPFTTYNGGIASYPAVISSSGNFVLPNAALPMINVVVVGGGGGAGAGHGGTHGGGGGGGGGNVIKLTAIQAVGTTGITIGSGGSNSPGNDWGYNGGTTYFGNVYALGGGGGGGWNNRGAKTGADIGNTGGAGAGNSVASAGAGTTQTTLTGLGTQGAPTFYGGNAGGGVTYNTTGSTSRGGGGAGSTGAGTAGDNNSGGVGGTGHVSTIGTGSWTFGPGGYGVQPNGGNGGNQYQGASAAYGYGGYDSANGHSSGSGQIGNGGGTGAVVLRYYIP
jgi:hypothetical protein